jgi:hypothetical protein
MYAAVPWLHCAILRFHLSLASVVRQVIVT